VTGRLFTETFINAVGGGFLESDLSHQVVLADVGEDAVSRLLGWPDLSEILSTRALEPPRLRLHRKGVAVPLDRYTERYEKNGTQHHLVQPEAVYRELREGASMILDAVDRLHPPLREATDDLMRLVRERAQVNMYLLWGSTHGFDTHWDNHDTFIVQVIGTKSWTVHGMGRKYPMKADVDHDHTCPDRVEWEGVLRPGQILHVPRGWWHTVRGTGEVSLHLTFGWTRATGVDWASWLVDRLRADEAFRQDLPRFAPPERRREHARQLARRVAELAAGQGPQEFLADRDERFPRRRRFNLPWPVAFIPPEPTATVEFAAVIPPTISRDERSLTVGIAGKRYRFAPVVAPVVETLARRGTMSVKELQQASRLDQDRFHAVLETLDQQHLILIHS
jgi:mannose-6-phosphate isomerase-like protein (cupin superfamily)